MAVAAREPYIRPASARPGPILAFAEPALGVHRRTADEDPADGRGDRKATPNPPPGRGALMRRRGREPGTWPAVPRRALLAAAPLLPLAAAAQPGELRFRILREGSPIGLHRVIFTEADGALSARTEVDIQVKLMGITVFRFQHRFTEVWAGGRLRSATTRRDRNGTVTEMVARADASGIQVQGPEGALRLPANAAPLSWWDVRRFDGRPLFANDTGKPVRLQFSHAALPDGGVRWSATGEEESEGRYAADGHWIAWKTRAEDGSTVTYERIG
jgi:hypothetical protein